MNVAGRIGEDDGLSERGLQVRYNSLMFRLLHFLQFIVYGHFNIVDIVKWHVY